MNYILLIAGMLIGYILLQLSYVIIKDNYKGIIKLFIIIVTIGGIINGLDYLITN